MSIKRSRKLRLRCRWSTTIPQSRRKASGWDVPKMIRLRVETPFELANSNHAHAISSGCRWAPCNQTISCSILCCTRYLLYAFVTVRPNPIPMYAEDREKHSNAKLSQYSRRHCGIRCNTVLPPQGPGIRLRFTRRANTSTCSIPEVRTPSL
jgi:hypothetical protein